MKSYLKIGIVIIALLLFMQIVAADFNPREDITGKNVFNIKDFVDINGTNLYQDGNLVLDTSDINGTTFNYTTYANSSTYWDGETDQGDLNVNYSNRTNYWDDLDSPADINASEINNDGTYILSSDEGDLNVNHSDSTTTWADLTSINSTQFISGLVLSIKDSWFSSTFDTLFGAKDTDDLTQGSSNFYDNQSWNQTHADTLYIAQSEEGNLNVNSSTFWASVSSFVDRWFYDDGDVLSFNETLLNTTIQSTNVTVDQIEANTPSKFDYLSYNVGDCYQEFANVATECGGLGTGTYEEIDDWGGGAYAYANAIDGDWATRGGDYNGYAAVKINYTKPELASNESIWTVKYQANNNVGPAITENFTIYETCFEQDPIQLQVELSRTAGVNLSCYTGTSWYTIKLNTSVSGGSYGASLYEEAMTWDIDSFEWKPISEASVDYSNSTGFWAGVSSFIDKWFYDDSDVLSLNETMLEDTTQHTVITAGQIQANNSVSTDSFLITTSDTTYCYQESANTSNQTGIDGDCKLIYTGTYGGNEAGWDNNFKDYFNIIDGSYSTLGDAGSFSDADTFYVNYTKPPGALNSSVWRVKTASPLSPAYPSEYAIPSSCWNAYPEQLSFYVIKDYSDKNFFCRNSTGWELLYTTTNSYSLYFYDEAMNWSIATYEWESVSDANVNSSNYWDSLDDPTDITSLGTISSATSITSSAFVGDLTGNAATATALASNPTDCSAGSAPYTIDANGNFGGCTPYYQTSTDSFVYNTGDSMEGTFNWTNSTLRLDDETNMFFYDTGDEAKHLNSFAENYDKLRTNTFTTVLELSTFTNATGIFINISSTDGKDIGVILQSGTNSEAYRFDYNNIQLQLNEGTDAVPILNRVYVYNNAGTPTWVVSTTQPVVPHAMAARVNVGASGYIYWASLQEDAENGFLKRVQRVNRKRGLLYEDGLNFTATSTNLAIGEGSYINSIYDDSTTSSDITTDGVYTIHSNGSFTKYTSLADLMSNGEYGDGFSFGSNKYVNVVFGITPFNGDSRIYAVVQNKPNTEYTSVVLAYADSDNKLNVYPSDTETRLLFLPVARMIMNTNGGAAQIITGTSYAIDYRGGVAGGVSSGGGLTEADPIWTADKVDYSTTTEANLLYAPISVDGTVTSIATTAPISGGTITSTGTLSLAACGNAEGYVYNTTSGAWECLSLGSGSGTVTSVDSGVGLTGGPITGSGTLSLNTTYTDTLYAPVNYGDDWNKTYADTLYAIIGYGDDWNKTYADTLYAVIGYGDDWNKTYADTLYRAVGGAITWTDLDTYPSACSAGDYVSAVGDTLTCSTPTDTTYSAGNGIALTGTTFSVAAGTALTQDASGLSVTNDAIGDTQLQYDTGQHLTTTSDVTFNNITASEDIIVSSGQKTCYDGATCAHYMYYNGTHTIIT